MLIHALLIAGVLNVTPPSCVPVRLTPVQPGPDTVRITASTSFGIGIAPVPDRVRAMDYLLPGEGVVIVQVMPGGVAEAAHLRAGDMILSINGKRVDETTIFTAWREVPRGQRIRIEFVRAWKWEVVDLPSS